MWFPIRNVFKIYRHAKAVRQLSWYDTCCPDVNHWLYNKLGGVIFMGPTTLSETAVVFVNFLSCISNPMFCSKEKTYCIIYAWAIIEYVPFDSHLWYMEQTIDKSWEIRSVHYKTNYLVSYNLWMLILWIQSWKRSWYLSHAWILGMIVIQL